MAARSALPSREEGPTGESGVGFPEPLFQLLDRIQGDTHALLAGWEQALQLGARVSRLILAGSPGFLGEPSRLLPWLKVEKARVPPARVPGGGSDTAEEILWWPSESLPSAPKGNSPCSPWSGWEVSARAAEGLTPRPVPG